MFFPKNILYVIFCRLVKDCPLWLCVIEYVCPVHHSESWSDKSVVQTGHVVWVLQGREVCLWHMHTLNFKTEEFNRWHVTRLSILDISFADMEIKNIICNHLFVTSVSHINFLFH